jgi:hypothetical protein
MPASFSDATKKRFNSKVYHDQWKVDSSIKKWLHFKNRVFTCFES